ncbi:hypothetical protein D3C87_1835150 [compost metagenome]
MGIAKHLFAAGAAEQLVEWHVSRLGLDVPERGVDAGNRRHRHRAAAPIGSLVEILPGILDPGGIAADQERHQMIFEIGDDSFFAAIQCRIAHARQTLVGKDLDGDKVAPR